MLEEIKCILTDMEKQQRRQEQVDEFQDTILRSVEQHTAPYSIKLKGQDFVIFPETFNPCYAKASLLLLNNLGVREGDVVLDPFTGSGADAIFAILEGAEHAVAIDKYSMPFLCASYNVHALGLDDKVDVRQGNLFEPIQEGELFDLVIANPPFRNMNAESNIAAAVRDQGYKTLEHFWTGVGEYLQPNGRIRIVFSNVGDLDCFHKLAKDNGFKSETVAQATYASDVIIEVYEMTKKRK